MTPTVEANPGLDTAFDDVFDSTATDTATGESTVPDEPETDNTSEVAEPVAPIDEEPAEEEPEATEEEAAAPEDVEEGVTKSPDQRSYRVSPKKFADFQGDRKYAQSVREFAPTVEQARAHYEAANDFRHMEADFLSGEPDQVEQILQYFAGEAPGIMDHQRGTFQRSFGVMAEKMPEFLQRAAPKAYDALQDKLVGQKIEALYQKAGETGDADDLKRAQWAEWAVKNEFRKEVPKVDPQAARLKEIEAREKALQTSETKRQDSYWNNTQERIDSAKQNGLNAAIDEALKPATDSGQFSEDEIDAFRLKIGKAVSDSISKNFEWDRNHNLDLRSMRQAVYDGLRNNSKFSIEQQAQAYIQDYLGRARPVINSIAPSLINRATAGRVAGNKALNNKLSSSQRKGTASPGKPTRQSIASKPATGNFDADFDAAWG